MRGELKKNIFHLAWSPDSLPASESAAPLLDCLDHILSDLEPNLLPAAFQRCVAAIWDVLLLELWAQAELSSAVRVLSAPVPFAVSFDDLIHPPGQILQVLRPSARRPLDAGQLPARGGQGLAARPAQMPDVRASRGEDLAAQGQDGGAH